MKRLSSVVTLSCLLVAALLAGVATAGESPANTVAVCGCGKVFVPDAQTKYVEFEGQKYACCTDACHAMASKDPAAAAKMAQTNTKRIMGAANHVKMDVANVVAVTEHGTKAVCGCGKVFTLGEDTEYIEFEGENFACCTHQCHEMAMKDPATAAKSARANVTNN